MIITFLIGNGFDISLAEKYKSFFVNTTTYRAMYDWNSKYEYSTIEQKNNRLTSSLYNRHSNNLWSDFESGLVSSFLNLKNPETDIVNFFRDKDQLCNYINDYLRLFFQERINETNYTNECLSEFQTSVLLFQERMQEEDKRILFDFVDGLDLNEIYIDFINFNGTNTLEHLINELKKSPVEIAIGNEKYNAKIRNVYYVHSKLEGKTGHYHEYAFGTTQRKIFEGARLLNAMNSNNNLPSSIINALDKTNYDFKTWISNTSIFVTHGLSFGETDEFYWVEIAKRLHSNSILIDFPFANSEEKGSTQLLNDKKDSRRNQLLRGEKDEWENKVIICINAAFKNTEDSSSIFSF